MGAGEFSQDIARRFGVSHFWALGLEWRVVGRELWVTRGRAVVMRFGIVA